MSVLVSDRSESKYEAITFAQTLHSMLTEFMGRDFGVKDVDNFVRRQYANGKIPSENYSRYRFLMQNAKDRIDTNAAILTSKLVSAYRLYPTNLHEYQRRRDLQNEALGHCEILIHELQHIVEVFEVDINRYGRYIEAIDREIDLIKRWRVRDNKIKSCLESKGSI